jgi:hypothetical protein
MPTPTQKRLTIDKINDALLERSIKASSGDVTKFYNRILTRTVALVPKGKVTSRDIRKIINATKISQTTFLRQTYNMTLLSGITNVIENQRLASQDRRMLKPIVAFLSVYSPKKPQLLAQKIDKLSNAFISRNTSGLNKVELKAFESVKSYFNQNRDFIKTELKANAKRLTEVHKQIKSNISKTILKDLKREINTRIEVKVITKDGEKIVKRPKTFVEIRKDMRAKFGEQIDFRVRRMVDTELHDLAENTKQAQHLLMGFTNKKWNTQGDSKVRDEKKANHVAMNGTIIPIKNKFRVAGGGLGMYPSDPELPPRQRINCRCFLTYTRT